MKTSKVIFLSAILLNGSTYCMEEKDTARKPRKSKTFETPSPQPLRAHSFDAKSTTPPMQKKAFPTIHLPKLFTHIKKAQVEEFKKSLEHLKGSRAVDNETGDTPALAILREMCEAEKSKAEGRFQNLATMFLALVSLEKPLDLQPEPENPNPFDVEPKKKRETPALSLAQNATSERLKMLVPHLSSTSEDNTGQLICVLTRLTKATECEEEEDQ